MNRAKSEQLFLKAKDFIPGGVNSPVRSFSQVGGTPVFMQSASGAKMYDVDGNGYIDYINSWGPMILGHNHPEVVSAVESQVNRAFSFGAPSELELKIAELMIAMVPGLEMVRMVNSGTEACMSAVRLARGVTQRAKVLKFEGHYHGHSDVFLKKAGSGVATLDIKVNAGVPSAVTEDTLVASFNDWEGTKQLVEEHAADLAAIIVEPVAGNMGCVPPQKGFLEGLRTLCDQTGALLIFDEVMTGFRLARGGAQELFNIRADLVTFGKVIGGGLPVGAFGGKKKYMEKVAPLGEVYQAGTLSGNPIAMISGYTTLGILDREEDLYAKLNENTTYLAKGLRLGLREKSIPVTVNQLGSMISVHFCENPVVDFQSASAGNNDTFKKFFHYMLDHGIYLPPSAFETWFISKAITKEDLDYTIETASKFQPE